MSLLKRLSDGFWSYVSPRKGDAIKTAPQTVPRRKTIQSRVPRRASLVDKIRDDTSMDPLDRIHNWRDRSPSVVSKQQGTKRKYPSTPSTSRGRGRLKKIKRVQQEEMEYTSAIDHDENVAMQDDESELSTALSNIRVDRSPSSQPSKGYDYPDSDIDIDDTLVVSEAEYTRTSPPANRRKIISPTTEHFNRGVDTNELRAAGWDDDHITLMQKLADRGFEPLMPAYWKFDYSFMPDALFAEDDDAFVSSVRGDHFRAIGAFEKLLELGGRVRDRIVLSGRVGPERESCMRVQAFMKWAEADAQLYSRTSIPVLVLEHGPQDTPATVLQENARKKCARLAQRWHDALAVKPSIEPSSASYPEHIPAQLAYPIPTLYAIVASHTLVALTAYNPADASPQVKSCAFFDMQDPAYDVWNALAMAIVVCHVRNVQLRIMEETGVGARPAGRGRGRSVGEDPDA